MRSLKFAALLCFAAGAATSDVKIEYHLPNWTEGSWKEVMSSAEPGQVIETLEAAGWNNPEVASKFTGLKYDLYSSASAPGQVSYIAVPDGAMGSPLLFLEGMEKYGNVVPAGLFGRTSEEIQQEIMNGMQAAIDGLCQMRARPDTIRAQASAFGIVEVEATWTSAEVCEERP